MKPRFTSFVIWCLFFLSTEGFAQSTPSGGGSSGWDDKTDQWRLKREVQIGDFLTSITLMAGFTAFLIATIKDRRKKGKDEERSGALRLLLKILRENHGPMEIVDLKTKFEAPETKQLRDMYCGKRFSLNDRHYNFDGLLYGLHWEGKVDFSDGDRISFRLREKALVPSAPETFTIFKNAFLDLKTEFWRLDGLALASLTYNREETLKLLAESIKSQDTEIRKRAVALLGNFAR